MSSYYEDALAQGVDRFLEPRVEACPWCGSPELGKRVRSKDNWQGKPGHFQLDECRACGHVFQNPRLTIEGLDFYYKDFYDGLGQPHIEATFDGASQWHRERAEMVRDELAKSGGAPKRWLDVGCGYGHFAKTAREVLPDTTFDGLDMGIAVTIGEERGWLDTAHQGMLPDLAGSLVGQYDVVSMHHYLEHTREPKEELDAAAQVLGPGGLLLIEVPNPEYRVGRLLGRWWIGLGQPQHQHLIPMGNLVQALHQRGFTPVATANGHAHQPTDAAFALPLLLDGAPHISHARPPYEETPWLAEELPAATRSGLRSKWSSAVQRLGYATDKALTAVAHRTDHGNAYRVLARRDA